MMTEQEKNNPHSRPPTRAERVYARIMSTFGCVEDEDEDEEAER